MRTIALLVAAFGTWKIDLNRSTFGGDTQPRSLNVRIERHVQGEVFTQDRVETDGRLVTSSSILYLDGEPRSFQDLACSGIETSRRTDSSTVEVLRMCSNGSWTRSIRRFSVPPREMVLEITEQRPDGRRFTRRLLFEKR